MTLAHHATKGRKGKGAILVPRSGATDGFRHAVGQRYTFLVTEMIDCTARRSGASCAVPVVHMTLGLSDAMKIVHEGRPVARHCHGAGRLRWCIGWVDPQR